MTKTKDKLQKRLYEMEQTNPSPSRSAKKFGWVEKFRNYLDTRKFENRDVEEFPQDKFAQLDNNYCIGHVSREVNAREGIKKLEKLRGYRCVLTGGTFGVHRQVLSTDEALTNVKKDRYGREPFLAEYSVFDRGSHETHRIQFYYGVPGPAIGNEEWSVTVNVPKTSEGNE